MNVCVGHAHAQTLSHTQVLVVDETKVAMFELRLVLLPLNLKPFSTP